MLQINIEQRLAHLTATCRRKKDEAAVLASKLRETETEAAQLEGAITELQVILGAMRSGTAKVSSLPQSSDPKNEGDPVR